MQTPNPLALATAHRRQIIAILFVIGAFSVRGLSDPDYEILPRILSPAVLKSISYVSIILLWFTSILLARQLYEGVGLFVICVLSTVPPISILVWLIINSRGTKVLRDAGAKVGFFGAKRNSMFHISGASDPGGFRLSSAKLKTIRPDMFGIRAILIKLPLVQLQRVCIKEHLLNGDSRAAVVVRTAPLLIAAYSDDLDCVAMLRFPDALGADYGLAVGSRLITANTYSMSADCDTDLIPGPLRCAPWTKFNPLIADFISDDVTRLDARKSQISESEWERAAALGEAYLSSKPNLTRDGRPIFAARPARTQE